MAFPFRSNQIFLLTAVVTVVSLAVAWYYFSQDYSISSEENSLGQFIQFHISDVGFGADSSFTMEAYLHEEDGQTLNLGPIARMGNRQMVSMFVENGKWLDDQHYQAQLDQLKVGIVQTDGGWQMRKTYPPRADQQ